MVAKKKNNVLTIKTTRLQEMVSRSLKGVGINLPITKMMAVHVQGGVLKLVTTDGTNTLYISENVGSEDFYAVVLADVFGKLIGKITSENIIMKLSDNGSALEIEGNGKYSVPIQYDGDSIVEYYDPLSEFEAIGEGIEISRSLVSKILTVVKPALAVTMEEPCYTGYYVGDKLVATNQFIVDILDVNLFGQNRLISSAVMDLLGVMEQEKIHVDFKDAVMVFSTKDCTVYSHEQEGIEDFAVDSILEYLNVEFPAHCKITKSVFLQVLDRLSLFVTDLDDGAINLIFTKEGLQVSSRSSTGVEVIPYVESENFTEFSCCTNIGLLIKQVKSQLGDTVDLWYGDEVVLKLVDGNVTKIIALLENSSEE